MSDELEVQSRQARSAARNAPVRDVRLTIGGVGIHYRDWGDVAAPPLVLLHGAFLNARTWDTFAEAMADRFRVLALDMRGCGESDWATDYSVERALHDVEEFVDGLARFSVVGSSLGCRLGCAFAAQHPERVERLVMAEAFMLGPFTAEAKVALDHLTSLPDEMASVDEAVDIWRPLAPRASEAELRYWITQAVKEEAPDRWVWRVDPFLRKPGPPGRLNPQPAFLDPLLSQVTCPTLLVYGTEGWQGKPAHEMATKISGARVAAVPHSGHFTQLDNPDGFLNVVRDFLLER